MAVPYDRGGACRGCGDVLRWCCIDEDPPDALRSGYCCECNGWEHTDPRPSQEAVSPLPAYL